METIVALATGLGGSAIGLIRLSGKEALEIVLRHWRFRGVRQVKPRYAHLGELWDGDFLLDEGLLIYYPGPHSYTGEDVVELSLHGSAYILRRALSLFQESGARMAQPGEFTLRAYLNGKLSLDQAEAVASLIAAQSQAAHRLALSQLRGQYYQQIRQFRQQLIDYLALLELEMDFSEEDVEFASRARLISLLEQLLAEVDRLLASYRMGQAINEGIPIAIVGKPNAGKSTLLNALVGESRAIVSAIPGTTRDTLEERIFLGGYELRLIDTAGLREAPADEIEAEGIRRARAKLQEAFLILYVFEAPNYRDWESLVAQAAQLLGPVSAPILYVANKRDLLEPTHFLWQVQEVICISAQRGEGLEALQQRILKVLEAHGASSEVLLSIQRHYAILSEARSSLQEALDLLSSGLGTELVAQSLRRASRAIGEITGEITPDDILGSIFSRFCIGK